MIKAAKLELDGNGRKVFVGIEELADESVLTDLHLPQITECDLDPGQYHWVENKKNTMGGEFVHLPKEKVHSKLPDVPALNAIALAIWSMHEAGLQLEQQTRDWFNTYIQTVDASSIRYHQVATDDGMKMVVRKI